MNVPGIRIVLSITNGWPDTINDTCSNARRKTSFRSFGMHIWSDNPTLIDGFCEGTVSQVVNFEE